MGPIVTEQQFRVIVLDRFDQMDRKLDNLASQIGELNIRVGAVETRLGAVEDTVNKLAFEAGIVPGRPEDESRPVRKLRKHAHST